MARYDPPELLMVSVWDAEIAPTRVAGKLSREVDRLNWPAATPEPVSAAVAVIELPETVAEIASSPGWLPEAFGEKPSWRVQLAPEARDAPQLLVTI
jgi:hypothetical protein